MTTSFIRDQIDMGSNDLMLELSKQLADIVKSMVHNEIQMAQQQVNKKDNSNLAASQENTISEMPRLTCQGATCPNAKLAIWTSQYDAQTIKHPWEYWVISTTH